jgi:formylglycine-generating enzyme required for sulfatase activity
VYEYPYVPDYEGAERENLSAHDHSRRVLRGVHENDHSNHFRSAYRGANHPGFRGFDVGFRLVVCPFVDPLDI